MIGSQQYVILIINNFLIVVFRYEMQDLHVTETLPQIVALSEAYMQIYEQHEW